MSKKTQTDPQHRMAPCKLARKRLFAHTSEQNAQQITRFSRKSGISFESPWILKHISTCPRCQKRFASMGRVFLGLNLIKSQAHTQDLVRQANTAAVDVLKHNLRHSRSAQTLKSSLPIPTLKDRFHSVSHSLYQSAACIAILILSKMSIFSSVNTLQKQGQTTVRDLYDRQLGTDLSQDLFRDNA